MRNSEHLYTSNSSIIKPFVRKLYLSPLRYFDFIVILCAIYMSVVVYITGNFRTTKWRFLLAT
jgi:hypothetical protein